MSQAWGGTGASDGRRDRRRGDGETGWGAGRGGRSLTHGETHRGGHERRNKEGNATPQDLGDDGTETVTALSSPSGPNFLEFFSLEFLFRVTETRPCPLGTRGNPGELRNV